MDRPRRRLRCALPTIHASLEETRPRGPDDATVFLAAHLWTAKATSARSSPGSSSVIEVQGCAISGALTPATSALARCGPPSPVRERKGSSPSAGESRRAVCLHVTGSADTQPAAGGGGPGKACVQLPVDEAQPGGSSTSPVSENDAVSTGRGSSATVLLRPDQGENTAWWRMKRGPAPPPRSNNAASG